MRRTPTVWVVIAGALVLGLLFLLRPPESAPDPLRIDEVGGPSEAPPLDGGATRSIVTRPFDRAVEQRAPPTARVLSGRAMTEERQIRVQPTTQPSPVAGAHIEFRRNEVVVASATTDSEGIFHLALDGATSDAPAGLITATSGALMASAAVGPWTSIGEEGLVLWLRPTLTISARVTEQEIPQGGVSVTLALEGCRVATASSGNDGTVSFATASGAQWSLRASRSDGALALTRGRTVPRYPIRLELQAPRVVLVTVTEDPTGDPIAGAQVASFPNVLGDPPGITDAVGTVQIRTYETEGVHLFLEAKGHYPTNVPLPGDASALTISMRVLQTHRWRIAPGPDVPPDGTPLRLTSEQMDPLPGVARIESGYLIVDELPIEDSGIEFHADRAVARAAVRAGRATEPGVTFQASGRLRLRVISNRPQYDSLAGRAELTALDGGSTSEGRFGKIAVLSPRGEAEVIGLAPGRYGVDALGTSAIVSILPGDNSLELELPTWRTLLIRLESKDGDERLGRANVTLSGGRMRFAPGSVPKLLKIDARPDGPLISRVVLRVSVADFAPVEQEIDLAAPGDDPIERTIALERGGEIRLTTLPTAERAEGLRLERQVARSGSRQERFVGHLKTPDRSATGEWVWKGLEPGRYRVRDGASLRTTQVVEIQGDVRDLTLDLANLVTLRGRVVRPAGFEPASTDGVVAYAAKPDGLLNRLRVTSERLGRFSVLVPSEGPIVLGVADDHFVPHPEQGLLHKNATDTEVVLELIRGRPIAVTIPNLAADRLQAVFHNGVVKLTRRATRDRETGRMILDDAPFGRWSLRLLGGDHGVLDLGVLELGPDVELGPLIWPQPASLEVRFVARDGPPACALLVTVTNERDGTTLAQSDARTDAPLTLLGLEAGYRRLVVEVADRAGEGTVFDQPITLASGERTTVTVDLP